MKPDATASAPIPTPRPRSSKAATAPPRTPTQRSLRHLEAQGYLVAIVEHWNPFSHTRSDLWGFVDLLAVRRDEVLAVQVTDRTNVSKRVAKIAESDKVPLVREAGIRIVVHGWGKMASGKWELREVDCS